MKKLTYILVFAVAFLCYPTASIASPNKAISTGTCLNGSEWSLVANRSGNKVSATITVKNMPWNQWNVNWAWTPSNTVFNQTATPKNGKLVASNSSYGSKPLTALVFIDEPWAYTLTCVASVTI